MSGQVAAVNPFADASDALRSIVEPGAFLHIDHYQQGQGGRERLEAFVQQVFLHAYAARISTFYPQLIGITRPDGAFAAVAGIRAAEQAALFAEYYLDAPVETLISVQARQSVARAAIAEVGNLAPASAGQARWLIAALTAYLHAAGFNWVVFTAVSTLSNAFARLGLRPVALAVADVARLDPQSQDDWGRYYDARPVVYAGDVGQAFAALGAAIVPQAPKLWALWHDALQLGAVQRLRGRVCEP